MRKIPANEKFRRTYSSLWRRLLPKHKIFNSVLPNVGFFEELGGGGRRFDSNEVFLFIQNNLKVCEKKFQFRYITKKKSLNLENVMPPLPAFFLFSHSGICIT